MYSDIYLDEEGTKDAVGDGIHSALHDKRKESSYHLDFSNGASKSGFAFANHETYESGALFWQNNKKDNTPLQLSHNAK